MKKLKFAIIGCGEIFLSHWEGYVEQREKGFDDFEIAAFCDLDLARARKYAGKYKKVFGKEAAVFQNTDDLLHSETDFQVASIQIPHSSHHVEAIKCLNEKKHVMIEKPLAITLKAARMMMDCAIENGVQLKILEDYRYALSERAAAWAVRTGLIGQPRILNVMDIALRQWSWDWRDEKYIAGGGWTLDGGIHFADLWMNILGPVEKVTAVSRVYDNIRYKKFVKKKVRANDEAISQYRKTRSIQLVERRNLEEPMESNLEDTTSAFLEFENGVLGTWVVSRSATGRLDRTFCLSGSEGSLIWKKGIYDCNNDMIVSWNELQEEFLSKITSEEREFLFPKGLAKTMALEQREFIDYLYGRRELEVTAQTGYEDLALVYAVYESAAVGQSVLVKDVMELKAHRYQEEINKVLKI
ncbi:MAG: Gfo/Idh/MocA family oxidoreductase [Hungatella sp.]|nr:Gfo/Idh/MocA family oxidoreductase [Hungatella sp.]